MTRITKIRIFALFMAALMVLQLGQKPAAAAVPPSASCLKLSMTNGSDVLVLSAGRCL